MLIQVRNTAGTQELINYYGSCECLFKTVYIVGNHID